MTDKKMRVGLNVFAADILKGEPGYSKCTENGKLVDFVVCHFGSSGKSVSENCEDARKLTQMFKDDGISCIANFEFQNFDTSSKGPDGYEWANRPDGTHLLNLPEEMAAALSEAGNLDGVIYDELEHVIINRNAALELGSKGKIKLSAFPLLKCGDVYKSGEALNSRIAGYAASMREKGVPLFAGEHVFQALYHTFARNGIIPNFKSQKESFTTVQFMLAAGAALEYGTELWNCVDSWFMNTNPGHTPGELYHNLVFAYLSGVSRAYAESCDPMLTNGEVNDYGKSFMRFAAEFKGKARAYDISDYRPEIGIINYDDTYWGQCGSIIWKKMLFGDETVKPNRKTREHIRAIHLITHGETCPNGINWGRMTPWSLKPHRSFSSVNSAALFDDRVRKGTLESLRLCFLCGVHISPETLKDVYELVRKNGLTVVTSRRFLPGGMKARNRLIDVIKDGKGTWIVTEHLRLPGLKRLIKPYLGKKGYMRLTFAADTVEMKITKKGDAFEVI